MMDLIVPDLGDPCSLESLRRKLKVFGLSGKKYSTEIQDELKKHIKVRIHQDYIPEAYNWCQERFEDSWTWSNPIQTDYVDIYFIDRGDAVMFKLRFTPLDA